MYRNRKNRGRCVETSNPLKTPDIRESKVCRVLSHKFGVVKAHRTSSNPLKTHDIRESKVCRVLSRFEGVEPLGNSVQVPYTTCYHCEDEVREGSVQSNHSELTSKTSTHLAFSALKWFEEVRGG